MTKEILLQSMEQEIRELKKIVFKRTKLYETLKNDSAFCDDYLNILQEQQNKNSGKTNNR